MEYCSWLSLRWCSFLRRLRERETPRSVSLLAIARSSQGNSRTLHAALDDFYLTPGLFDREVAMSRCVLSFAEHEQYRKRGVWQREDLLLKKSVRWDPRYAAEPLRSSDGHIPDSAGDPGPGGTHDLASKDDGKNA
eukprot:768455-Hanusia_phi.AAC.13